MRKTMLWGALLTLICTQVQAEVTPQPTQSQTPGSTTAPVTNNPSNQEPVVIQNNSNTQPLQGTQQGQPKVVQPGQNIQNPQQTQPVQQIPAVQTQTTVQPQAQTAPVINCDFKIPASTKTVEQSLVLTWAEKAATQAFDFDPTSLDTQMQKLKACFTDQGWTGFSSALEKSGNLDAIKTQKLTVSSQLDGQAQVTEAKDNQWKITLPLQVVYQNDKEKVTQLLSVNLTVGRKVNGDLGIAQMIATPRTSTSNALQQSNSTTTPNEATGNTTAPTSATPTPSNTAGSPTETPATNQPANTPATH
ncbi:DotI/IcmL family type IV secretion protein [Legionella maioricensis]|uniref:DotI/IcmL/TraM family protein n=1 Tax=Legionella maioricensis TaxID=2896528 RepID=A0A9X2IAV8_9GAMM|nr:DotI/IcmL/TraM family protein [Legionella maioricensis]MCL9683915.1 DotI/IcmL/TraM family protein [Legionella maioricensis]MCL9688319.1 DotI/IcmL/TraM family protein [Legionella maioricensis]